MKPSRRQQRKRQETRRKTDEDLPSDTEGEGRDDESFGTWLRRQREGRRIELREIADASKVSLRYFQAFEEDRFEALPAPVFAKGFLRQYALYVGLDPEEAVNFFLAARESREDEEEDLDKETPGGSGGPNWQVVVMILAVVALAALVWGLSRLNADPRNSPDAKRVGAEPTRVVERPAPVAAEEPPAEPAATDSDAAAALEAPPPGEESAAPDPATSDSVVVTLDFTGDCWIEAEIDGTSKISEMHVQGESLRLVAARQIDLLVGDATTLEMEINGLPYPIQDGARSGGSRRVRIDRELIRRLSGEENG